MAAITVTSFHSKVLTFYKNHGRFNLPWRKTRNPYRIFVSEIMLQQTQVDRVVPYYKAFLKKFPTHHSLADASLADVVRLWHGLGYNRRAKMLHEAAQHIEIHHKTFPRSYEELVELPGVGDYTAKAIRVFAYDKQETLIETNIRSVYLYHFFKKEKKVPDREILKIIEKTMPRDVPPRVWYAALMDYGSHIKKTTPNPSRKSTHHTRQTPFKGSNREVRGAIVKFLLEKPKTTNAVLTLPFDRTRLIAQLSALEQEGIIIKKSSRYQLPD